MEPTSLWRVSVGCAVEAEEATMALLGVVFASRPTAYHPAGSPRTQASVFLNTPPAAKTVALLRKLLRLEVAARLETRPGRVRVTPIAREDWAEAWKRHFPAFEVGRRLLVRPGWSPRRARPGQRVVVLDPGLSFGTGHHPTTEFCLRQIVLQRPVGVPRSFLDLGTGSGILAIAAAKLGYSPVVALDHDPAAVRVAKANARRNGVLARIRLSRRDVTDLASEPLPPRDVVAANLSGDLLSHHCRAIAGSVSERGTLVLAGILSREFASVTAAYERIGFRVATRAAGGEWVSGCLVRKTEQRG